MKNLLPLFLLFGLLASSFVSAEDRTSDPNDINVPIVGTDDNWQVNLASQDRLTNEDFNIALKIEQTDQDDDDDEDFDDFNDSDDDNDDDVSISGARKEGFEKTADGDFDLNLIRKEILRKARDDQDIDDDIDYTNDNDDSDETPQVEPVDFDLRPDNGRISTQVISTDDEKNEIEDSDDGDDGDDADIVDDQDDSHGDDVDDDYQQDNDSAMADDDYVNEPDAAPDNLYDDMDYDDNNDDDDSDDGDDRDEATDNDDLQDYVKNSPFNSVNLQRMKLNITTIDIRPQDSDDTDDNLDDILFDADDSSDDEDSDFYDIYDTKYREELERGGLGSDEVNASDDYDIFIDIDDSAWASILTEERRQ